MNPTPILVRISAVIGALALTLVLSGCLTLHPPKTDLPELRPARDAQIAEHYARAEGIGDDILAQIAPEEISNPPSGGGRSESMDAFDVKGWPRTLTWEKDFALYADGPRTPRQVADDLTPWLLDQGWDRSTSDYQPSDPAYAENIFLRDQDLLAIRYTVKPPPYGQTMVLMIRLPRVK
ncbi:hypothetical protein D9V32_15180 [Mycetocola tolaasinivorans]|uniref:Uncharacterized protein n=1 Tax=Mycetocola tolaasinivorans TaxID=76635 RepID=A0A3L6ZYA2_9MICO|nr:hypothetical protein [Mycetocola tolaasinivorans]RLP72784.1 hypothetical protein D9V32_15180 [Mycetocola tolaasinivorans]